MEQVKPHLYVVECPTADVMLSRENFQGFCVVEDSCVYAEALRLSFKSKSAARYIKAVCDVCVFFFNFLLHICVWVS